MGASTMAYTNPVTVIMTRLVMRNQRHMCPSRCGLATSIQFAMNVTMLLHTVK